VAAFWPTDPHPLEVLVKRVKNVVGDDDTSDDGFGAVNRVTGPVAGVVQVRDVNGEIEVGSGGGGVVQAHTVTGGVRFTSD